MSLAIVLGTKRPVVAIDIFSIEPEAELRSALGIGALYSSATVEDVCQAAENIVKAKLNFNRQVAIARSNEAGVGKLYFQYAHSFYVGQTITVENCGQHFNGSKTITETSEYTVSFSTAHLTTIPKQDLVPYGYAYDGEFTDFSTLDEVRQASLMIAVDIAAANTPYNLQSAVGGLFYGAQTATREQAMSVPSVARARNIICSTIGSLPLETYNHFTKEHSQFLLRRNFTTIYPFWQYCFYSLDS